MRNEKNTAARRRVKLQILTRVMARAAMTPATAAAPHLSRCIPAMIPPALISKPPAGSDILSQVAHVAWRNFTSVVGNTLANQKDSFGNLTFRFIP